MNTKVAKAAARRTHAMEFKEQVIEACLQPGVSVAAVALANGLNANYLRRCPPENWWTLLTTPTLLNVDRLDAYGPGGLEKSRQSSLNFPQVSASIIALPESSQCRISNDLPVLMHLLDLWVFSE